MLKVDSARKVLAETGAPSTAQVSKLPALPASTTSTERRGKKVARRAAWSDYRGIDEGIVISYRAANSGSLSYAPARLGEGITPIAAASACDTNRCQKLTRLISVYLLQGQGITCTPRASVAKQTGSSP
jgi:hypothetical protein